MISSDTRRIYKEILKLTPAEKMFLVSRIFPELSREFEKKTKRNIYDLKGLGKKIWKGTDAQEYVNKERDSWE
ncbi:MAG: hypothetical protein GY795_27400 [Desulfobacterales bacterium]|nr:hypothetical protein [Desulfobacterales bacterium]